MASALQPRPTVVLVCVSAAPRALHGTQGHGMLLSALPSSKFKHITALKFSFKTEFQHILFLKLFRGHVL